MLCLLIAAAMVVAPAAPMSSLPAGQVQIGPSPPKDHAADRFFDPAAMEKARRALHWEHGGMPNTMLLFNLAEYNFNNRHPGVRWDGEAWFGGDYDRLVVTTDGESARGRIEDAEVKALWSHAIDPYFDVRAGIRQDIRPTPAHSYATIGIEGIAPYWFDVEADAFLSEKGRVSARLKLDYDQRITQKLIVQPRAEFNLAASKDRARDEGAGLMDFDLGVRVRYEIRREFAPYLGISWNRKTGDTADLARAAGEEVGSTSLVTGIRIWF
jgi:copper resistance protein B